ncbi:FAD-binding oxidoreductase [Kutzneria sp. 744]|uniref:FAD-binding oxidoreductase n=1 Tax=Kutzneria sp. (strain 744) TaxID=345341 RepID=UPI0003EED9D6|nr:FAD-dependent oxidoreductase [Kutzneria sp. 744]EWM11355.1 twin-arginine translocation pathway signal protein [Kutzneria sp. 744]
MDTLARALTGRLVTPSDAEYARAKLAFLALYDDRRPAAIAWCETEADVQRCVEFAATQGIPVAARSGGHSYAGYSTPDGGLIIDVSHLDTVEVRADGAAIVGAGARMAGVYAGIGRAGRMLSAGTCPTVGIAGLTLGGGIGVLGRKCGLASDQLIAARIVTADGTARTVSETQEPDLFWALRGGGGGNFGVVTSFTFRTTPAEPLTVWSLDYTPDRRPQILDAWQEWQKQVPDEMWSQCRVGRGYSQTAGCLVGTDTGLIDDLARRIGGNPVRYQRELDFPATMDHYADPVGERESFVSMSRMLTGPMDAQAMVDLVTTGPELFCLIDSFGGAIAHGDGAFPHRDAIGSIQVTNKVRTTAADARGELAPVRQQLGEWFGAHGFVNYIDPDMPNWRQAYYGANAPRLAETARTYDPNRVFAFPQGI